MERKLLNQCIMCWKWLEEKEVRNNGHCTYCGNKAHKVCSSCKKFEKECKCLQVPQPASSKEMKCGPTSI